MVMESPTCTDEAARPEQEPVYGAPLEWEEVEQLDESESESLCESESESNNESYASDSEDEFIEEDDRVLKAYVKFHFIFMLHVIDIERVT